MDWLFGKVWAQTGPTPVQSTPTAPPAAAPPGAVVGQAVPGSLPDVDMSIVGMFIHADPVVKVVAVLLILASFWAWAIIIEKTFRLRALRSQADRFEESFWSGGSLEDLYDRLKAKPSDPLSVVFCAAMGEWRRSVAKAGQVAAGMRAGLQQRIDQTMGVAIQREIEAVERRMTFLASVGSIAPFVGLFGTVWGIMNSFQGIAMTKNTSLAAVAPGIAEALFVTALGLVAAVPAVIAYNKLSSEIGRYGQRLENFAAEFGTILSRQLEEGR